MCLITEQIEPFIAEEDIIVYKLIRKDFSPAHEPRNIIFVKGYKPMTYEIGKLNETEIKTSESFSVPTDEVEKGLIDKYGDNFRSNKLLISYGQGFHSFINNIDSFDNRNRLNVECTVPKGSEYYLDGLGFMVSNKIIINKVL